MIYLKLIPHKPYKSVPNYLQYKQSTISYYNGYIAAALHIVLWKTVQYYVVQYEYCIGNTF